MTLHEIFTPAVIWFLVGLALLLLELAIPGLFLIFFGIGAWIVALLLIFFDMGIAVQLLIFGMTSVLGLILLRRIIKDKFFKEEKTGEGSLDDEFIDKIAIAESNLTPDIPGKVSFKGTHWNAVSDKEIKKGGRVKIIGKESITLKVTTVN